METHHFHKNDKNDEPDDSQLARRTNLGEATHHMTIQVIRSIALLFK